MEATLTSKGRITLPKPLRDHLHLNAGDRVKFLLGENGRVELIPVSAPVARLKGMMPKPAKPVSIKDMDTAIAHGARGGCALVEFMRQSPLYGLEEIEFDSDRSPTRD